MSSNNCGKLRPEAQTKLCELKLLSKQREECKIQKIQRHHEHEIYASVYDTLKRAFKPLGAVFRACADPCASCAWSHWTMSKLHKQHSGNRLLNTSCTYSAHRPRHKSRCRRQSRLGCMHPIHQSWERGLRCCIRCHSNTLSRTPDLLGRCPWTRRSQRRS
jgi:hypothetical protein